MRKIFFLLSLILSAFIAFCFNKNDFSSLTYFITLIPAWILFLGTFFLLLISISKIKKRSIVLGFLFWLACFAFSEDYEPWIRMNVQAAQENSIRIVTWNTKLWHSDLEKMLDELEKLNIGIAFLQEVTYESVLDEAVNEHPLFRDYQYFRHHDNVFLSRYPLEIISKAVSKDHFLEWHSIMGIVKISKSQEIFLLNIHLRSLYKELKFTLPQDRKPLSQIANNTTKELSEIIRVSEEFAGNREIIIAGDFNLLGSCPGIRNEFHQFQDVFKISGTGWGKTFPATFPVMRIDQIHVSQGIIPLSSEVISTTVSDHRPVVAELKFID